MYDFIAIGDTTLDTFLHLDPQEVTVMCSLDKEKCELCMNYADKIPVREIHDSVAGNAANAAVTAARLGLKTALWTIMGDDSTGKRSFETFKKEGIGTKYFEWMAGRRSNASTVINIEGERTILIYHEPKNYRLPSIDKSKWLYLTSMSQGSESIFDDVANYLIKNGVKLAYQPGTFQLRLGPDRAKELLANTEVFFVNKEEAAAYTGGALVNHDIKALLDALRLLGPKTAVVTDGTKGAYASDGKNVWFLDIIKEAPRIEATGAGDAFASGFVAALCHNKNIPEAMRWGSFNSSGVIQKIGPQAGILTLEQLKQWDKKYREYRVKRI